MAGTTVTPAIDAGQIVDINPSVLGAGGNSLNLNGLIMTDDDLFPYGKVISFPNDGTSLADYAGATADITALGDIYFLGFNGSQAKPAQLFAARYAWGQPIAAWLRGSALTLTLAQLQALSGSLSVTIDGSPVAANISLALATSFSNAASLIGNALGIKGVPEGIYSGSISGTTLTINSVIEGPQAAQFVGSISGTTLNVQSVTSGTIAVGNLLTGSGVTAGTTISALGSGEGSVGTYTVSQTQVVAPEGMIAYQTAGKLQVGSLVTAVGVQLGTYISGFLTGAGGVGTYSVNTSQTFAGGTLTAFAPGVTYGSISGAFRINSGTTGVNSSVSYASGTLATPLGLTQADDAMISLGAAQDSPASAMTAITKITKNWASFMTDFEPNDTDKIGFAQWTNSQNNRYHYAMWDTNALNLTANGPSQAVGAIEEAGYSAVSMIYDSPSIDTVGGEIAAFVMGYGASIDFEETQGRATAAFKSQTGLAPQIFNTDQYNFLLGYGMNCYGSFTTADENFTFYSEGSVTGDYDWLDSYLDQIWLTNELQLAGMVLLTTVRSIPYNQAGYGMIYEALKAPILEAVNAGVIQPGTVLSATQIADVNAAAGQPIDGVLSTIGWYLQIVPTQANVRVARTSPQINLWYCDGGSIQKINVNSVLIL